MLQYTNQNWQKNDEDKTYNEKPTSSISFITILFSPSCLKCFKIKILFIPKPVNTNQQKNHRNNEIFLRYWKTKPQPNYR